MEMDKTSQRWNLSFQKMRERAINLKEDCAKLKKESFGKDILLDEQKREINSLNNKLIKKKTEKTIPAHLKTALKYATVATIVGTALSGWFFPADSWIFDSYPFITPETLTGSIIVITDMMLALIVQLSKREKIFK